MAQHITQHDINKSSNHSWKDNPVEESDVVSIHNFPRQIAISSNNPVFVEDYFGPSWVENRRP